MSKQFDVVVIGGGPGGYIAAIRAAQLGFQVACIDEWKNAEGGPAPGGTCTNVGCIPSKALLQSSEHFDHANHHFADHGISAKDVKIDVAKMIGRKDTVVKQNNDGILYLFKKNKVTFFHGRGSFASKSDAGYEVKVTGASEASLVAKQVIVATGSSARALPGVPFDEDKVLSNDGALRMGTVPKKLAVIGSGVIGLEMGSVWRRLGSEVTILEGLPTFLGAADEQIAKEAKKAFDKQGLRIELGVKVGDIKTGKKVWDVVTGEQPCIGQLMRAYQETHGSVVAVMEVALTTVTEVAATPPIVTVGAPVKLVPVMVTAVPPAAGPLVGDIAVTVGAGTVACSPTAAGPLAAANVPVIVLLAVLISVTVFPARFGT